MSANKKKTEDKTSWEVLKAWNIRSGHDYRLLVDMSAPVPPDTAILQVRRSGKNKTEWKEKVNGKSMARQLAVQELKIRILLGT